MFILSFLFWHIIYEIIDIWGIYFMIGFRLNNFRKIKNYEKKYFYNFCVNKYNVVFVGV